MGGRTKTWANFASVPTVWAKVKPVTGRENDEEGRMNAVNSAWFTIRNRSDVDETARIVWDSENWNIRRVDRRGTRAMYLYILAERGVAQ